PVLRHEKDFLMANDEWFRGIAINYGPDGGVYVTDWCDTGECHNYDRVDKTNGRIYKVVYGQPKADAIHLGALSNADLVVLHAKPNEWFAGHARRILIERAAADKLPASEFNEGIDRLNRASAESKPAASDSQATVRRVHETYFALREVLGAKRTEAFRAAELTGSGSLPMSLLLGRNIENGIMPADTVGSLAKSILGRNSRVKIASGLRRLEPSRRWAMAEMLAAKAEDAEDPEIPLLLWYAIEPLPPLDPARSVTLLSNAKIPLIREFIARRLASLPEPKTAASALDLLVRSIARNSEVGLQRDVLHGIQAAFAGRRDQPMPAAWQETYPILAKSDSAEVRDASLQLAVLFGDARALDSIRSLIHDTSADKTRREKALQSLVFKMPTGLRETLDHLLDDAVLRPAAIKALARFDDPRIPPRLLVLYEKLSADEREDVRQTLASRPKFALALLDAVAKKHVDRADLNTVLVRQMLALKDKQVAARVAEVWGTIRPVAERKAELTKKYRNLLTPDSIKTADAAKGKALFTKNCASCHKLFGEGGDVGPDLTGSQRANLEYLLENVLDPSAVVAKEYQATVIQTSAGRTITGIVKSENEKTLTIQTANEILTLPKDEIEARMQSKASMMPEGILEQMPIEEVRALVAYLGRPTPLR
ncbi:MAG TPA: c-type cytochrome, partial [Gemmataceae bacterium]|nr:c-type cytochrome [Gemmataceae bacterium]